MNHDQKQALIFILEWIHQNASGQIDRDKAAFHLDIVKNTPVSSNPERGKKGFGSTEES